MSRWQHTFLVLGSLIAGVCVAVLALPSLFERLPNELKRTQVILKALHRSSEPFPDIVVLGNSIAMNGVDTNQLRNELPGAPLVWNLSSTGQLLIESTLIVDELPSTTDAVLLTVFTADLIKDASDVPESKLIAYLQYGFQPSEPTLNALQEFGSPKVVDLIAKSKWEIAVESRWAIRSAIDISCRSLLRKDLDLSNATKSLFFPTPFTSQQSQNVIETVIARKFPFLSAKQGHLSESYVNLLKSLAIRLTERKKLFYIAVLPEHPRLRSRREKEFYKQLTTEIDQLGKQLHVPVFSFLTLLDGSQFSDHIHPNSEGAMILTSAMASEVAKWQFQEGG